MINRTNVEHLVIALVLQALIALVTGDWLLGALFSSGIFLGREHAKREYHIGDPCTLVGYEALDFWRWSIDSLMDLILPVTGVILMVLLNLLSTSRPLAGRGTPVLAFDHLFQ